MIELLNSKKMVLLVMILVFACVLIIILEGILTESDEIKPIYQNRFSSKSKLDLDSLHQKKIEEIKTAIDKTLDKPKAANKSKEETNSEKLENTSMCWLNENHLIKEPCSPCSDFETAAPHQSACQNTGYKELVKCEFSGEVYRSCIVLNDSHSFWSFQFATMLVGFVGYCLIQWRNRQLDRKMLERLRRQLQSGV